MNESLEDFLLNFWNSFWRNPWRNHLNESLEAFLEQSSDKLPKDKLKKNLVKSLKLLRACNNYDIILKGSLMEYLENPLKEFLMKFLNNSNRISLVTQPEGTSGRISIEFLGRVFV